MIVYLRSFEDINNAYNCLKDTFPYLENRVNINDYIEKLAKYADVFVYEEDSVICGLVAIYANNVDTGISYITLIGVDKSKRSQGIGSKLFNYCIEYSKQQKMNKIRLEVNKDNTVAIAFYKRHGLSITGDASNNSFYMEIGI